MLNVQVKFNCQHNDCFLYPFVRKNCVIEAIKCRLRLMRWEKSCKQTRNIWNYCFSLLYSSVIHFYVSKYKLIVFSKFFLLIKTSSSKTLFNKSVAFLCYIKNVTQVNHVLPSLWCLQFWFLQNSCLQN